MIYSLRNNYYTLIPFMQMLLIIFIILFSFFVSFDSDINKLILKIMIPLWILSFNFKNILHFFKYEKLFSIIIIFSLWILITCIITLTFKYPYEQYIKYFLLPILVISTSIKKKHIKYIIGSFLIGMFINELISYGIYFEIIKSQIFGFNITGNKFNPIPFMPSHMEYTLFLSLAIIFSIFSFFSAKNKVIKFILFVFTLTMTTNLFLTTGRTGQFTLLVTLLIMVIIYFRHSYKYIIFSLLSIIFVFFMGFFFSDNVNKRLKQGYDDIVKVIEDKNYNTSLGVRMSSYIIIPNIIQDSSFNILYGTGYSNVNKTIHQIHIKEFGEDSIFKFQEGHLYNSYITIFVATGLIGFILLMFIWYYMITLKIEDKYLNYIRYSFVFVIFFGGFTENMFRQKEVMMLSAVFISIIIYVATKNYKEES